MTQELNLYVEAGDTFAQGLSVLDDSNNPVNITTYQIKASLKKDFDSGVKTDFIVTVVDAVTGKISISLDSTATYALGEGKFYFDCQYITTNRVKKFAKGILTVYPTVCQ